MTARLLRLALALFALINIGRGSIHSFASDGGAHSIAGLDLTGAPQTILSLFATIGLNQLCVGLFEAYVVVQRRDMIVPVLALQTATTAAGVFNLHLYRPLPVVVPGAAFNLALLGFLAAVWVLHFANRWGNRQ